MPKLFWRKELDVDVTTQSQTSRDYAGGTRGTEGGNNRDSPSVGQPRLFRLQEELPPVGGGGSRHNQDLLHMQQSPSIGLKQTKVLDASPHPLDTFRTQLNNGRHNRGEIRVPHVPIRAVLNGHIPSAGMVLFDSRSTIGETLNSLHGAPPHKLQTPSLHTLQGTSHMLPSPSLHRLQGAIPHRWQGEPQHRLSNGSVGLSTSDGQSQPNPVNFAILHPRMPGKMHGSIFEPEHDDDIQKMAAQRDQLRGVSRNVRGMMPPITSKQEDSRMASASKRQEFIKQQNDSILEDPQMISNIIQQEDMSLLITSTPLALYPATLQLSQIEDNRIDTSSNRREVGNSRGIRRRPEGGNGGVGTSDYLDDTRHDIMAQSLRRQSLRGSKHSLSEGNLSSIDHTIKQNGGSLGTISPNEFTIFRSESSSLPTGEVENEDEIPRRNLFPSSHEDIQILNLQGFMDGSGSGLGDPGKKKPRKRRNKHNDQSSQDGINKVGSKSKDKKRKGRSRRKSVVSDDDNDVTLKDLDDIDNRLGGMVIGPKQNTKTAVGRPITLAEATDLRVLLTGNPAQTLPQEWMKQNLTHNPNPNLSYGLVQKKGGPCGVLACIQAHVMKALIYGASVSPNTSPVSPLRPSRGEFLWALGVAITEIIWRASGGSGAVLALPESFAHFLEHGVGRYTRDGLTEALTLFQFSVVAELHEVIVKNISAFTTEGAPGCVLVLYASLLSRGLEKVKEDMDTGGGHLINMHGYAAQEVVNLMLTGKASTNTFDGDKTLGGGGEDEEVTGTDSSSGEPSKLLLRGIQQRSEIGMLSLFEHYGSCKVGGHLKSPEYPVWVICSESHYSCLFSRELNVTSDTPSQSAFSLFFYDGLALQEDEIKLTIDLSGDLSESSITPPLEHCIRTKWPNAAISWNGTEPIL